MVSMLAVYLPTISMLAFISKHCLAKVERHRAFSMAVHSCSFVFSFLCLLLC